MRSRIRLLAPTLGIVAAVVALPAQSGGPESIVVSCVQETCVFQKAFAPLLNGDNGVTLVAAGSAGSPQRSGRLDRLAGMYREPATNALRVFSAAGELGEQVRPSRPPRPVAGAGAPGWSVDYSPQATAKTRVAVPLDQFVALLRDPEPNTAVVRFARQQAAAREPHPWQRSIIAGAVTFASGSTELRQWRDELRTGMSAALTTFRSETADPATLETLLAEATATMRTYRLIAPQPDPADALQRDLTREYQRLQERFAVAIALKNAGLHDAFIDKVGQIGLARWSRQEIVSGLDASLQASATAHYERARELLAVRQFAGAFDEARLAASRAPCNEEMSHLYDDARVRYVTSNQVAALAPYDKEHVTRLQQLVRELQNDSDEVSRVPERDTFIRKRIADGEQIDRDYLPLQLKKAEFLEGAGELKAAHDVIVRVQREVTLGRAEAEQWLTLDARLNQRLRTVPKAVERQLTDQVANGQFKEALAAAADGLRADPFNPQLLYYAAISAGVMRDHARSREYVQRYFRNLGTGCGEAGRPRDLLDLSQRPANVDTPRSSGLRPNWMSGDVRRDPNALYDPVSGSFNVPILSTMKTAGKVTAVTEFRWEGYLVTAIITNEAGTSQAARRAVVDLEPVYDANRVYMNAIGSKASQRKPMPLRYRNSPDFDPILASRFSGRRYTRGWAGNPFFHPFIWDGIYLFDLEYDDLGRIKEAIPVPPEATRPDSPFSEALTFTWDGTTSRLRSIAGRQYRREMTYDDDGRLVEENITFRNGKGRIRYVYERGAVEPAAIECEDNFYDRGRRTVRLQLPDRR